MILFIVSLVAGMLSVLAPCVLPLLPVILAGSMTETSNRRRPIVIITALSLSVFVFTLLLKGSTALIGASPSFWNYISAAILIAFGLTLIFPEAWARIVLKIPGHNKPDRWIATGYGAKSTFWTDVVVGAALGPVFTTCSPTFFVILATVLPQSLAMGMIDLAAYIAGLALVLFLVAFIGQKLVDHLGWATDPKGWFRKALGILFIIVAVCIAFGWDKVVEADILESGFFDVTTIEQSFHQALQGPTSLPGQSGASSESCAPGQICPVGSSTVAGPGTTTMLPAAPLEKNEGRYVEIKDPAGFVNTPGGAPISIGQFIGTKVILIDFIDYSCINCERTFPYLNDWWMKYKDQGLEVVAIHTPEFSFEKDIVNVTAAAKQFKLQFPIVLDNSYSTWNAYGNEYWPHKYIIDIHGNVVYDKIGEGGDDVVEAEIVKLLNDRMAYLGQNGTVSTGTTTMPAYAIQAQSPETYFGAMRNDAFGNGAPYATGAGSFTVPVDLTPNEFYLGGKWDIEHEYAQTEAASSSLSYVFNAANMYLVAASANGTPVQAAILIDGKPITAAESGADVKNGILTITGSRLYSLYSSPDGSAEQHHIDIIFKKAGAQAFTFTFG